MWDLNPRPAVYEIVAIPPYCEHDLNWTLFQIQFTKPFEIPINQVPICI